MREKKKAGQKAADMSFLSLRRKFTLIFVLIIMGTLTGVFAFVMISMYQSMERDIKSALERVVTGEWSMTAAKLPADMETAGDMGERPGFPTDMGEFPENESREYGNAPSARGEKRREPGGGSRLERYFRSRSNSVVLLLEYDLSGNLLMEKRSGSFLEIDTEEVEEIGEKCLAMEENYEKLSDYALACMRQKTEHGIRLACYDLTQGRETMYRMTLNFLIAYVPAIFLCIFIGRKLSSFCVSPIEEMWQKQRNFVADASHELKTPLTVILANAAMLKEAAEKREDGHDTKCIRYIEEEGAHMSRLLNDMLFLAKTDALRGQEKPKPVDFSELCMNVCLSFESIAYESGLTLETEVEENITVTGVEEQLCRLVAILLDNACKYTKPSGIIRLSLSASAGAAVLEVENPCEPIPKEKLSRLKDRFYRADASRSGRQNGYGLGLSIAERIVSMHGGRFLIRNESGTDMVMRVELKT